MNEKMNEKLNEKMWEMWGFKKLKCDYSNAEKRKIKTENKQKQKLTKCKINYC